MKKSLSLLLVLFLAITVFAVTGCTKKNDPTASFKNPKTIKYKTDKGTIELTYDDDGTYEVVKNDPYVTLKNSDGNFRIDMDYSNNTVEGQKKTMDNFAKDTENYKVFKNVSFNGYDGNVMVSKKWATTNVYLNLDKENDIVSNIKVSPVMSSKATEKLESGKKAEDVLYKQAKVQQILKTVKYTK